VPDALEQIKNKIAELPAKVALIRIALMPSKARAPRYFLKRFQCPDVGAGGSDGHEMGARRPRMKRTANSYPAVIAGAAKQSASPFTAL